MTNKEKISELKKLTRKLNKVLKGFLLPDSEKLKVIDEYYPGPQNLTDEEVLMFADFDSLHEYQFFIATCRKMVNKLKQKHPDEGDYIDELLSSGGTTGSL